jgi:hypothetical protein
MLSCKRQYRAAEKALRCTDVEGQRPDGSLPLPFSHVAENRLATASMAFRSRFFKSLMRPLSEVDQNAAQLGVAALIK